MPDKLVSEAVAALAKAVSDESDSDVYLYNGEIKRGPDLAFMLSVHKQKVKKNAIFILVTAGGDAHAAYKIARYMQNNYETFTVVVPGLCKSAGTLIAVGAHCVAFAPYGEIGPIDVQTYKTDNLAERQSGLTITESIDHLTRSAIGKHSTVCSDIMAATDLIISFKTATQAASELVAGLYAPIISQIDPMEVGEKARSMRIASDYGQRLNAHSENLRNGAIEHLTQTYPSHSFVIDMDEAQSLFKNIRELSEKEQHLVDELGIEARGEVRTENDRPIIRCLSGTAKKEIENDEATDRAGSADEDGENSSAATETSDDPNEETVGIYTDGRESIQA